MIFFKRIKPNENMKQVIRYLLLGVVFAASCSKTKTDILPGNQPTTVNLAPSTIRIMLPAGAELMVNGDTLTNFLPLTEYAGAGGAPPTPVNPTPYFPATGKTAGPWYLPKRFLDGKGQATVKLYSAPIGSGTMLSDSFQVTEDYAHPTDYYLTAIDPPPNSTSIVTPVPRAITPASDPTHIRIRLVNLGEITTLDPTNAKPLTLAFADGTPVSTVSSGIVNGKWSDYVELPYGTYQFRVLADGTPLQIPGTDPLLTTVRGENDYTIQGGQYYVPTFSFQPGGAYSIVVMYTRGCYQFGDEPLGTNCFTLQTDISSSANLTYARVQGVNAAEQSGVHFWMDGADSSIGYGVASGYASLIAGTHDLKVTDASGKVLTQKNITVKGNDNLTAWIYPGTAGDSIVLVQNNMGGLKQSGVGGGEDVTNTIYDPLKWHAIVQTRFLNLCPDLPYVTFTRNNGSLWLNDMFSTAAAAVNLQPGKPADPSVMLYPYIDLGMGSSGKIQAYASQPSVVPGDRLKNVDDLEPAAFVRMPGYYYPDGAPGMETGVYTVALIGRNITGQQPKMIVIKHNL